MKVCTKAIVEQKWSSYEPNIEKTFFGFPPLRFYLIESAFGSTLAEKHQNNRFWAEDIVVSKYLQSKEIINALSLCCGFGSVERRIVPQLPHIRKCVAVDIAFGALQAARTRARNAGLGDIIEYVRGDLNNYSWQEERYDLIVANGALHHLENLEGVIEGIKLSLKPGGILYANEFVGASYQDYPVRQLELINSAIFLLPSELRQGVATPFRHSHRILLFLYRMLTLLRGDLEVKYLNHPEDTASAKLKIRNGILKLIKKYSPNRKASFKFGIVHDSQKAYFMRTDPSEGVRASDIIPLLKSKFSEVEVRFYGGPILAYSLGKKFYDAYNHGNLLHRKTLETLWKLEQHYIEMGEVCGEHAILIARK